MYPENTTSDPPLDPPAPNYECEGCCGYYCGEDWPLSPAYCLACVNVADDKLTDWAARWARGIREPRPLNILFVDDEPVKHSMFCRFVDSLRVSLKISPSIYTATTMDAAMDALEVDRRYDLICLDGMAPDGVEIAEQAAVYVSELKSRYPVTIILHSANDNIAIKQRAVLVAEKCDRIKIIVEPGVWGSADKITNAIRETTK